MRKEIMNIILAIVFLISVVTYVTYGLHQTMTVIDVRVETVDGIVYECTNTISRDNGMTFIDSPYDIYIPTRNIKVITLIK